MASTELDVVKISQLPAASSVNTTDVFPVSSSGATYKMSYDVLKDQMEDDISDILDSAVSAATTSATNSANAASQSAQSAAASAAAANDWASNLTIDAVPTDGSTNPVQSNGVYDELTELKNDIDLRTEEIPDTTQTITFAQDGSVSQIVHKHNNTVVRTDAFTFTDATITEVRTLSSGESLTIVTNLETLATTVTYAAA